MSKPCPTCGHVEPEPPCEFCGGAGWVRAFTSDQTGSLTSDSASWRPCPRGCLGATVTSTLLWQRFDFTQPSGG